MLPIVPSRNTEPLLALEEVVFWFGVGGTGFVPGLGEAGLGFWFWEPICLQILVAESIAKSLGHVMHFARSASVAEQDSQLLVGVQVAVQTVLVATEVTDVKSS